MVPSSSPRRRKSAVPVPRNGSVSCGTNTEPELLEESRSIKISERPPKPRRHVLTYDLEDRNAATVSEAPRKQREPSKKKEVIEDTDSEVEDSDEKERKSEIGPWPLKREKQRRHHRDATNVERGITLLQAAQDYIRQDPELETLRCRRETPTDPTEGQGRVGRTSHGAPVKRYQGRRERRRYGKYPNKSGHSGSQENSNDKRSTNDAPNGQNKQIPKAGQGRSARGGLHVEAEKNNKLCNCLLDIGAE